MDMIPDNEVQLDQQAQSVPQDQSRSPQGASEVIPDEGVELDSDKYGSTGQQALSFLEGAGRGATFGLSTGVEKAFGAKPEDIKGREEQNPGWSGLGEGVGVVGSAFVPGGEGALLAKAGHAVQEIAGLGKIGSAAIKGAVETGLFQGGSEISKAMLGDADPEAPVSAALSHMGAAALMGGVTGGVFGSASAGLAKLADTKMGSKLSEFAEDFGNRWQFNKENPDPVQSISKELHDFHTTTGDIADEVYGAKGLKAQAISKLVPEMNGAIQTQNQQIANTLQSKLNDMVSDPDSYPPRLTKKLMSDINGWMDMATDPSANSDAVFNATQDLKQKLQAYSKFDKSVGPLSQEKDFINIAKELQHDLVQRLEDPKVWGDAGKLQQQTNKAFRDYLPALKDFQKKFTADVQGDRVIDPGKINTYINQLGKPSAELKQGMLDDYINASEKYRNKISDIHHTLGIESPVQPSSLNATKATLEHKLSAGAQLADRLSGKGPGLVSTAADIGASVGHGFGGHFAAKALSPLLERAVGRPINEMAANAIIKTLGSGAYNNAPEAIAHADAVAKGEKKINDAVGMLFKIGPAKAIDFKSDDRSRDKLKKFVEEGGVTQQMQNSLDGKNEVEPIKMAEGGNVESTQAPREAPLDQSEGLANVYPAQDMLMKTAKGRIYNYLNAQRPEAIAQKLPFDTAVPNKLQEKTYNRALDIANQPLSVLGDLQKGTLTPDDMKHFTSMYPEIYDHLSKKLTEKVTEAQMNGDKPSYQTRQGLSLFLGAPLDSSFTPFAIQTAQNVYAPQMSQPAPGTPVTKNKRNTSSMDQMAKSQYTADQGRAERQAKV